MPLTTVKSKRTNTVLIRDRDRDIADVKAAEIKRLKEEVERLQTKRLEARLLENKLVEERRLAAARLALRRQGKRFRREKSKRQQRRQERDFFQKNTSKTGRSWGEKEVCQGNTSKKKGRGRKRRHTTEKEETLEDDGRRKLKRKKLRWIDPPCDGEIYQLIATKFKIGTLKIDVQRLFEQQDGFLRVAKYQCQPPKAWVMFRGTFQTHKAMIKLNKYVHFGPNEIKVVLGKRSKEKFSKNRARALVNGNEKTQGMREQRRQERQKRRRIKDTYPVQLKLNCKHKARSNDMLAELGQRVECKTSLVLDASSNLTSKRLHKSGWRKEDIHVPNLCDDAFEVLKDSEYCTAHHCTVSTFIKKCKEQKIFEFGLVYLDYCSPLEGRNKRYDQPPYHDIKDLFRAELLSKKGSVLAVTLCKFGDQNHNTMMTKLRHLVPIMALEYGLTVVPYSKNNRYKSFTTEFYIIGTAPDLCRWFKGSEPTSSGTRAQPAATANPKKELVKGEWEEDYCNQLVDAEDDGWVTGMETDVDTGNLAGTDNGAGYVPSDAGSMPEDTILSETEVEIMNSWVKGGNLNFEETERLEDDASEDEQVEVGSPCGVVRERKWRGKREEQRGRDVVVLLDDDDDGDDDDDYVELVDDDEESVDDEDAGNAEKTEHSGAPKCDSSSAIDLT